MVALDPDKRALGFVDGLSKSDFGAGRAERSTPRPAQITPSSVVEPSPSDVSVASGSLVP